VMCFTFPACASECAQCTGATATACTACKKGFYIDGSTCKGNQTLHYTILHDETVTVLQFYERL